MINLFNNIKHKLTNDTLVTFMLFVIPLIIIFGIDKYYDYETKAQDIEISIKEPLYSDLEQQDVKPMNEKVVKIEQKETKSKKETPTKSDIESEVTTNDPFYFYESIPIKKKTQKYIEKTARSKELSAELIYAVAYVESGATFNNELITSEGSYSMFQLHKPSGTFDWLAKETVKEFDNINNFNWKNTKHSSSAAIWYLKYLHDYWINKGYSEEDVFALSLLSYNGGIGFTNKYIQNHNPYDWKYVQKVLDYKIKLEKERYNQ